ncbi:MAG: ABC transporter permease [Prevotella sp.]|jgi:ribose transport system permease protein|nr:ABC transporter permease [Prevotella sp.]
MNRTIAVNKLKEISSKSGPVLALLIIGIFLSFASNSFLTIGNLLNVSRQVTINGFLSLGMMACILTGGIDLSIGFTMTLSSVLMAFCTVKLGWNPVLSLGIGLVSGCLLGLVNGLLLTVGRLPHPFISTMGTQNIYKGISLVITGATPIAGMPLVIKWAGSAFLTSNPNTLLGRISVCFIIMLLAYILFSIFLNYTVLGRRIYAVGGNMTTAQLSGVNVVYVRTMVYVISGLMAAIGGIIMVGRTNAAAPLAGLLLENDAIAAVVIGGTSFFGGRGNVLGTFSGVLLISVLRNGLNLLSVNADMQTIILGLVIIIAVFLDVVRNGGFPELTKKMKRN